ncbi:hypothetical protein T492DRAFT_854389 [Pavlovales sp. CCMP2436]|nr:hypothetical protein T492DRAFT_854389 [Pavlovales sp. CCMP2436]
MSDTSRPGSSGWQTEPNLAALLVYFLLVVATLCVGAGTGTGTGKCAGKGKGGGSVAAQ